MWFVELQVMFFSPTYFSTGYQKECTGPILSLKALCQCDYALLWRKKNVRKKFFIWMTGVYLEEKCPHRL